MCDVLVNDSCEDLKQMVEITQSPSYGLLYYILLQRK